jgi:exoribonuclease-2
MLPKNPSQSSAQKSSAPDSSVGALVQYEDDAQVLLGVITGIKKDKPVVFNQRGRELELARNRLYILPRRDLPPVSSSSARMEALERVASAIESEAQKLNVQEVWSFLNEEIRPYSVSEICQAYFGADVCEQHAGLRVALIRERMHFKRDRDAFEPRPASVVEDLRKAEEAKNRKKVLRESALSFLEARTPDKAESIPAELRDAIHLIEEVAALVSHTDPARQKEAREFVQLCADKLHVPESLSLEKRAFEVLLKAGIFHEHTNLSFVRHEIPVRHSDDVVAEAGALRLPEAVADYPEIERAIRRDLTRVRSFTIDDASTQDMDDALSIEQTLDGYELGIHITDVTVAVAPGSALDRSARRRGTSIYCADQTVNMLPESLSEEQLSLVAGKVRPCLSVIVQLSSTFEVLSSTIQPTFIKVHERYSYDQVDEMLENGDQTLLLLHDIAAACEERRIRRGAIRVHKRDAVPFFDGKEVRLLEIDEDGPARILVSEMMVFANSLMAEFAARNSIPVLFRGQERPEEERNERKADAPDGPAKDFSARTKLKKSSVSFEPQYHAGLGLDAYIQATSPIRRYMDLCHQRQFLEYFRSKAPWISREEFEPIAAELETVLQSANLASRETKRYWLLRYLEQRERNKPIEATVVRTDLKSPLVELDEVFITSMVRLQQKVKLGDRLSLKISAVDPHGEYLRLG